MSAFNRAAEIAAELEKHAKWRAHGRTVTTIATAILAAIPGAGAASVLVDRLGDQLLSAGLESKTQELAHLVSLLEPAIDEIPELDRRMEMLAATVKANAVAMNRLKQLVQALEPTARHANFTINTDGGTQTFVNVTIRDFLVSATAHNGGQNILQNVRTVGPGVEFNSSNGGSQHVVDSTFEGRTGSVGMNQIGIQGPVATKESGIALGDGGRIVFGGRAVMQATRDSFSIGFIQPQAPERVVAYEPIKAEKDEVVDFSKPPKLPGTKSE